MYKGTIVEGSRKGAFIRIIFKLSGFRTRNGKRLCIQSWQRARRRPWLVVFVCRHGHWQVTRQSTRPDVIIVGTMVSSHKFRPVVKLEKIEQLATCNEVKKTCRLLVLIDEDKCDDGEPVQELITATFVKLGSLQCLRRWLSTMALMRVWMNALNARRRMG